MIYGIGTDICDIRRIRAALERRGERFAETVLGEVELRIYRERQARWPDRAVRYLATRFSAKEAFSKAIGMGMHMPMTWRHCEILNRPSGPPHSGLHHDVAQWFAQQRLQAHITLSDESEDAASFCVVEQIPQLPQ